MEPERDKPKITMYRVVNADIDKTVGEKLAELQEQWGYTTPMLAEKLKLSVKRTEALLRDELPIDTTMIGKLFRAFGIDREYWETIGENTNEGGSNETH